MDDREVTPEELLGELNDVERKNAPERLYVRGDTSLINGRGRVSIVGARAASSEGRRRAARLARMLVGEDFIVVSGLAKGIDTAAHRAAIEAGGQTVAVIGTPLERSYPAENKALQTEIAEDHLLVSPFPPGTRTRPFHFPQRNRVMALLSHATVIIEAGETSGSLSQGWEALRLGRMLFIAQSVAEDPRLKWPAEMMRYGAHPLTDGTFEDLLEALPVGIEPDEAALAF